MVAVALPKRTVLLVDDSPYWTETIGDGLRSEGYDVTVLHDGLTAVEVLRRSPPQILITDYFLANIDGGKLCQLAKQARQDPPITTIILTGGADREHSRTPSRFADAVIAKNAIDIVFGDLRRSLHDLRESLPPMSETSEVVGHQRLKPRLIATKLHGMKQYLDALHEGIGDAVIGVDAQLRVYFLNSAALDVLDVKEEEALAQPVEQVLGVASDHEMVVRVREALAGRAAPRKPLTLKLGEATLRVTVAGLESQDGKPTAIVIARDISDLRAAEEARLALDAKLHQADKMVSLGQLVAGVSHEINNPLAALLPNLRLLEEQFARIQRRPPTPEEIEETRQAFEDSLDGAIRIRAIVAEMRTFAHPEQSRGEKAHVEELLEAPLALVANEARYKARIETSFAETPEIVVDRMPLSQAFLNILLNAAQAIGGDDPTENWIRVETKREAEGVVVEISNSGPRIPKPVLGKLFEPFFTTKAVGQGMGLGLSLALDTVKRHGGVIVARSDDDQPTTFRIWLPTDTGVAPARRLGRLRSIPVPAARLLVVDDDRLVRNSLKRILDRHHDVAVASTGERALELLAQKTFDLVLCDLIMPGMTGMRLYAETLARAPDLATRFVFLTGGTNSVEAREFLRHVPNPRAYKPLDADEILTLVDRALKGFRREQDTLRPHV
jgi:signal transduction histidine kinase/DNA-binding response OmpR family regulator